MDINATKRERLARANRIKAAKAARNVPTSILLEKKAECDARALKIVQRLIEPNVEVHWFLSNLRHINRTHMEDIVEERAIGKMCGYVLCDNPLTKVVNKKYQISTLKNKVYDIEKVKNFCKYSCYIAMDYIMMQTLTSPLWLRNNEEIPVLNILPQSKRRDKSPPGVEINIMGLVLPDDADKMRVSQEGTDKNKTELRGDVDKSLTETDLTHDRGSTPVTFSKLTQDHETSNLDEIQIDNKTEQVRLLDQKSDPTSHLHMSVDSSSMKISTDSIKLQSKIESLESVELVSHPNANSSESQKITSPICLSEKAGIPRKRSITKKIDDKIKPEIPFETLIMRIEKSFSEWITEDTLNLIHGDDINKQQIMNSVTLQDKYMVLCRKLNRIQLQEERDDNSTPIQAADLKPPPNYSLLKEKSKNLEIKVRAFYEGKEYSEIPEINRNELDENKESPNMVPLTDAHDPRALRRRIFLDKLNKILPDLLHALIGSSHTHCAYGADKIMLVKILVATFNLSPRNIIFRTAEWTLIGLIIIKMLSSIDSDIESLLKTKKATMYISMILMTYKLDSSYLDHIINSRIKQPEVTIDICDNDE